MTKYTTFSNENLMNVARKAYDSAEVKTALMDLMGIHAVAVNDGKEQMKNSWIAGIGKVVRWIAGIGKVVRWIAGIGKVVRWIDGGCLPSEMPYNIFTKNAKVDTPAFSVFPVVSCPGAGQCKNYCYSLKALRYPAPAFRMLCNTIMMRKAQGLNNVLYTEVVKNTFIAKIKEYNLKGYNTIRLHVDGDFFSVDYLKFWVEIALSCKDTTIYSYTKSFHVFAAYDLEYGQVTIPENFIVRLSDGHKYPLSSKHIRTVEAMHCTVGYFRVLSDITKANTVCSGACRSCEYLCASRTVGDIAVQMH